MDFLMLWSVAQPLLYELDMVSVDMKQGLRSCQSWEEDQLSCLLSDIEQATSCLLLPPPKNEMLIITIMCLFPIIIF